MVIRWLDGDTIGLVLDDSGRPTGQFAFFDGESVSVFRPPS